MTRRRLTRIRRLQARLEKEALGAAAVGAYAEHVKRGAALILAAMLAAAGCSSGHTPSPAKPPGQKTVSAAPSQAPAATGPCPASVTPRTLPAWARPGFHPPTLPMPYVMGDHGKIVAILWARHNPLHSPPLASRVNKILWVTKVVPTVAGPLRLQATLNGNGQAVTREVTGGPGPSIINLPRAGCWSFTLSWSGARDHLQLRYVAG